MAHALAPMTVQPPQNGLPIMTEEERVNPDFDADLWSPEGFKAGREFLGLSRKQLMEVIGIDRLKTLEIWESEAPDSRGPHPCAVRMMEWLIHDGFRPWDFPTGPDEEAGRSRRTAAAPAA